MLYQRGATYELVNIDDDSQPSASAPATADDSSILHRKHSRKHSRASAKVSRTHLAQHQQHLQQQQDHQSCDGRSEGSPMLMAHEDSRQQYSQSPDTSSRRALIDNSAGDTSSLVNIGVDDDELDELEIQELEDRLGEMIPITTLGRRQRREGLFGPTMARSIQPGSGSWDASELIASNAALRETLHELRSSGTLSKSESDEMEESEQGLRKYAKLILPHVALVLLTCAYTVIGAFIFYSVENPNEIATKRNQLNLIYKRQEQFVGQLLRLANSNRSADLDDWERLASAHMHDMSDHLFIAFEKYFLTSTEVKRNTTIEIWTFSTAIFFSVTVVTTIGYGNPVPVTQLGRMMCVSFSLFGIPLTLVTIADLGKFLSEHLIWVYGKYRRLKHYLFRRRIEGHGHSHHKHDQEHGEHVCVGCKHRGITEQMQFMADEQKIPALLVLTILVLYTALGGVLMSLLEPWNFFTSFYWSFITMTTVGFGDLMPRRDSYMYLILLYIILGLAITTMCIDLVGVQYIRKIHYFGRKIQDARTALAIVGGKVVLVSELYTNLMQKRQRNSAARDAFIIENLYVSKHIIPFIPSDIRAIRYIDQQADLHGQQARSRSNSLVSLEHLISSCRFCHSRFSISAQGGAATANHI